MFRPVIRKEIFRSSSFVDNIVAEYQRSYAANFDMTSKMDVAFLRKFYDHTAPFQLIDSPIDGHCIIAYHAITKKEYVEVLPIVLQHFFSALGISELFLLNFINTNLFDFSFENFRKRNIFKLHGGKKSGSFGYLLKTDQLHKTFPLFLFSGVHDSPVVFLMTATGKVPLSMHLCDDGNLHLNFQKKYEQLILETAAKEGFIIGDLELCTQYTLADLGK